MFLILLLYLVMVEHLFCLQLVLLDCLMIVSLQLEPPIQLTLQADDHHQMAHLVLLVLSADFPLGLINIFFSVFDLVFWVGVGEWDLHWVVETVQQSVCYRFYQWKTYYRIKIACLISKKLYVRIKYRFYTNLTAFSISGDKSSPAISFSRTNIQESDIHRTFLQRVSVFLCNSLQGIFFRLFWFSLFEHSTMELLK